MATKARLAAETWPVQALSGSDREAMWALFRDYYCDVTQEIFARDLSTKQSIILLFDKHDRKLRGFSTLQRYSVTIDGVRANVVYSGDTVIDKDYWGDTALQRAFFRFITSSKARRPLEPLYWFLLTKGYKTYLLLSRNFPVYYPRHDRPTPSFEAALLDKLARDKFGSRWQPDRGILARAGQSGRLREDVAPIDRALLERYADIRYFVEKNPGHAEGDELCCLGLIDATMAASYIKKLARLAISPRRSWIPWPRSRAT